jgi:hypothetical protein
MLIKCQLCTGYTTTPRRGLCRVCFDETIRPSELYDEMTNSILSVALEGRAVHALANLPKQSVRKARSCARIAH